MDTMATSSSATRYPYLMTNNSCYDESNDFIGNTLNTPEIIDCILDFHPSFQNEKEFSANSMFNDVYGMMDGNINNNLSMINGQNGSILSSTHGYSSSSSSSYIDSPLSNGNSNSIYYDRKSFSPMLESAEINLENMSSPEMAPVSPNKVCPQSDYSYQYDTSTNSIQTNNNVAAYQMLESAVPIKNEFEQVSSISLDFLNDQSQSNTTETTLITMVPSTMINQTNNTTSNFYQQCSPHSPASISSNYSIDSSNSQQKTFATLDNVQTTTTTNTTTLIKQEPLDSSIQIQYQPVVPTVVDETIVSTAFIPTTNNNNSNNNNNNNICSTSTGQIIYNLQPSSNTNGSNTNSSNTNNSYYYMTTTTATAHHNNNTGNNHTNNGQNKIHTTNTTTTTTTTANHNNGHHHHHQQQHHGRKRAAAANSFTIPNTTTNGQKKQRMSKREKQKLMESYIEKYERENKQLISQIELFEKQISFCKKYLSENVAPYIQRQQQQQQPIHQTLQSFVGLA